MRTSTLLAVLAALMLLVACAAPVFGQSSSSSSTGAASSSSSSATIIASSSSSTGTSTNNNTVASSSAASASSSSSGATGSFVTVTVTYPFAVNGSTQQQQYTQNTIQQLTTILTGVGANPTPSVELGSVAPGTNSYVVTAKVFNAPSNILFYLNNGKAIYPNGIGAATITSDQQGNQGGAASALSIGFAAVAVVFAALLQ